MSRSAAGLPLLVLHDLGDAAAGGRWSPPLAAAGWPGPVLCPDLPGHGSTAGLAGNYEAADVVFAALRALAGAGAGYERPVVAGVGVSGWAAQIMALGGRASALVLVDGLGGPWAEPDEVIAGGRRWLRAVAEDPEALAAPPPSGLDPRLRHGVAPMAGRRLAERAAEAMPVPVLIVATPGSPLPAEERARLAGLFRSGAELRDAAGPEEAAGEMVSWGRALAAQA